MFNPILLVNNLWDVGLLCQTQDLNKKAILNYNEALSILNNQVINYGVKANLLNNLGAIFEKQNNVPKALKCFNEAITIQKRLAKENSRRYSLGLIKSLNNLGTLYAKREENNKAINLFQEALQLCKNSVEVSPNLISSE